MKRPAADGGYKFTLASGKGCQEGRRGKRGIVMGRKPKRGLSVAIALAVPLWYCVLWHGHGAGAASRDIRSRSPAIRSGHLHTDRRSWRACSTLAHALWALLSSLLELSIGSASFPWGVEGGGESGERRSQAAYRTETVWGSGRGLS